MWIFGKKANQQSTTEVPPELQQYYAQPTLGSRLRRVSLFILPVLAFLVVLGAVISGAIWLRHHSLGDIPRVLSRQTNRAPTKPKQQTYNNPSPQQSGDQSNKNNQPNPDTPDSDKPIADSGQQPSSPGSKAPTPNLPSTIPSTGPGGATLAIATGVAIVGAAGFHVRQVRRLRSQA